MYSAILGNFSKIPDGGVVKELPAGVYQWVTPMDSPPFLKRIADKFDLNFKIYNIETAFIARVLASFGGLSSNLGVSLNGLKGTGKTVTAKLLCNALIEKGLPVIFVPNKLSGIGQLMSTMEQDCALFIDEFEKVFADEEGSSYQSSRKLLSMLDGISFSGNKMLTLFTSNSKDFDDNFYDRPSRIRYHKQFESLTPEVCSMIIDDCLEIPELKEAILGYLSTRKIVTVDIVKQVCLECNLHKESPEEFKDIFNISAIKKKITFWKDKECTIPFFSKEDQEYCTLDIAVDIKEFAPTVRKRSCYNRSGVFLGNFVSMDADKHTFSFDHNTDSGMPKDSFEALLAKLDKKEKKAVQEGEASIVEEGYFKVEVVTNKYVDYSSVTL